MENLDVLKNKTSKEVTDLKAELKKRDAQVRKIWNFYLFFWSGNQVQVTDWEHEEWNKNLLTVNRKKKEAESDSNHSLPDIHHTMSSASRNRMMKWFIALIVTTICFQILPFYQKAPWLSRSVLSTLTTTWYESKSQRRLLHQSLSNIEPFYWPDAPDIPDN